MRNTPIDDSLAARHKQSFEQIYGKIDDAKVNLNISFPLEEIDRFVWNRGTWNDEYYDTLYKRFSVHILSLLQLDAARDVLVIGCGFGFDEKNIKRLYPHIELWSMDISEEMVRKAVRSGSPGSFSIAMAEKLPFMDQSFDRIVSREVIEHVIDPQKMLDEIYRVLRPGGIGVITTENGQSCAPANFFNHKIDPVVRKFFRVAGVTHHYKDDAPTRQSMKEMVARAGLRLDTILFDGALYHYLPTMNKIFRSKMAAVAEYFSRLEHGPYPAALLCDQIKYRVIKEGCGQAEYNKYPHNAQKYRCVTPECMQLLERIDDAYICKKCKSRYPINNDIVHFLLSNTFFGDTERHPDTRQNVLTASVFRKVCNRAYHMTVSVLRPCYSSGYFALAVILSLFVWRKSNRRLLQFVPANSPLLKYLKR